jgi:hypothetical protein
MQTPMERLAEMEIDLAEYGLTYSGTCVQMAILEFLENAKTTGNLKTFEDYRGKYSGDGWMKIASKDPRGGLDTFYLAMAAEAACLRRLKNELTECVDLAAA